MEQMVGEEQMKMTFKKMSSQMLLSFDDVIYSSESIFHPNPSHLMRGMEIFHTLQLKQTLPLDKCWSFQKVYQGLLDLQWEAQQDKNDTQTRLD